MEHYIEVEYSKTESGAIVREGKELFGPYTFEAAKTRESQNAACHTVANMHGLDSRIDRIVSRVVKLDPADAHGVQPRAVFGGN